VSLTVLRAGRPLKGSVELPGDKSVSHRALIVGTLASGTLDISNLSTGRDVACTRRCLEALGAGIWGEGTSLTVRGRGPDGFRQPEGRLDCGNSGTTMRLLMGFLAGQPFESVLVGDESLSSRPMRRVADPLRSMGALIQLAGNDTAPVCIRGTRPLANLAYKLPVPSAQVKSALLLAGLYSRGQTCVEDPFGTRDHTERMFASFSGGEAIRRHGALACVRPVPLRTDREIRVPGDPSSGAFFAAAALLVPGSDLTLRGMMLNPSRMGFYDTIREMGTKVSIEESGVEAGEPVGDVRIEHAPLRAARVPAKRVPTMVDEVPLLAVLAARAEGISHLEGLAELRFKESDRLDGVRAGLDALGVETHAEGDALLVEGGGPFRDGRVDTRGDHRLAMAFGVAGLGSDGGVELSDAACAGISYPGFFDELERLRTG